MFWLAFGLGFFAFPALVAVCWIRPWGFLVKLSLLCSFLLVGCASGYNPPDDCMGGCPCPPGMVPTSVDGGPYRCARLSDLGLY